MRRQPTLRAAAAAAAALLATAAAPAAAAAPLQPAAKAPVTSAAQSSERAHDVYAYYYLWWSTRHWYDKLGPHYPYEASPLPLPAELGDDGCGARSRYEGNQLIDAPRRLFTQDNPAVLERDVRRAARADLAGFIVNWRGTGEPDQKPDDLSYSRRLDDLVRIVRRVRREGIDFSLWLQYKASSEHLETQHIINDLAYFSRRYGDSKAFARKGADRIVVVWGGSRKYSLETIRTVSTIFRPQLFLVGDENWRTWGDGRADYLDGNQYYWSSQNPYSNPSSFEQLEDLAREVRRSGRNPDGSRKAWFAPLAPGYNSELLREGGSCVPRRNGETLRRLFEGNLASRPDAWVLISWNEIAEGTYVRPLQRWRGRYLRILSNLVTTKG